MKHKVMLIGHSVDLGNLAIEKKHKDMLGRFADLCYYTFAPHELLNKPKGFIAWVLRQFRRMLCAIKLVPALYRAQKEDRTVFMQGIDFPIFTMLFRKNLASYIYVEWTRELYGSIFGIEAIKSFSPRWMKGVDRMGLLSTNGIICYTDAVVKSLIQHYRVPKDRIFKMRMPFDTLSCPVSGPCQDKVRIIFVGGNFFRKGGDIVLDWFKEKKRQGVSLTIITQDDVSVTGDGIQLIKNDPSPGVLEEYASHDILALPTRCDSYPQVLGEAACCGLAIATTKQALGAPEIVEPGKNGFIASDPVEFKRMLDELVASLEKINAFKRYSRAKMIKEFSFEACWRDIEERIFCSSSLPTDK